MDWFKWRKVDEYIIEYLTEEKERLSHAVEFRDKLIARLNKRLDAYENGDRCFSKHCASCKNACEVKIREYHTDFGFRDEIDVVCALDATCPDYKRKEE